MSASGAGSPWSSTWDAAPASATSSSRSTRSKGRPCASASAWRSARPGGATFEEPHPIRLRLAGVTHDTSAHHARRGSGERDRRAEAGGPVGRGFSPDDAHDNPAGRPLRQPVSGSVPQRAVSSCTGCRWAPGLHRLRPPKRARVRGPRSATRPPAAVRPLPLRPAGPLDGERFTIEMTPAWGNGAGDRGVVSTGPVGLRLLGRSRFFRYEVRRWRDGTIPDLAEAVGGPRCVTNDPALTQRLLDLVPCVPTATWGRDESRYRRHVELQLADVVAARTQRPPRRQPDATIRRTCTGLGRGTRRR